MALYTDTVTYDDLSAHAVTAPIACRKVTLRQRPQDSPARYGAGSPDAANALQQRFEGEPVTFPADGRTYIPKGATVGYVQPVGVTITFDRTCET